MAVRQSVRKASYGNQTYACKESRSWKQLGKFPWMKVDHEGTGQVGWLSPLYLVNRSWQMATTNKFGYTRSPRNYWSR